MLEPCFEYAMFVIVGYVKASYVMVRDIVATLPASNSHWINRCNPNFAM
jgi:hypothetical protein